MDDAAVRVLVAEHGLDPADARHWVDARRTLLQARGAAPDLGRTTSSGCAGAAAAAHGRVLAAQAAHALERLDAGLGTRCERCGSVLTWERLEAAPSAITCPGCRPVG